MAVNVSHPTIPRRLSAEVEINESPYESMQQERLSVVRCGPIWMYPIRRCSTSSSRPQGRWIISAEGSAKAYDALYLVCAVLFLGRHTSPRGPRVEYEATQGKRVEGATFAAEMKMDGTGLSDRLRLCRRPIQWRLSRHPMVAVKSHLTQSKFSLSDSRITRCAGWSRSTMYDGSALLWDMYSDEVWQGRAERSIRATG